MITPDTSSSSTTEGAGVVVVSIPSVVGFPAPAVEVNKLLTIVVRRLLTVVVGCNVVVVVGIVVVDPIVESDDVVEAFVKD